MSATRESYRLEELSTSFVRARCVEPRRVDRMKASLSAQGQLTPLVAVRQAQHVEIVDGFKRYRAATEMGWPSLLVTVQQTEEPGQWVLMLTLNRGPQSMSVLEEALVLREMVTAGLTQVQIGQLLLRHKSWVCRRLGLIERLHPELVQSIREGLLAPGAARRLLALPPGNQLEMAAVIGRHGLGVADTELLVKLWRQTSDPTVRDFVLAQPRLAIDNARDEKEPPPDPRLTGRGQRLQHHLRILTAVAPRALQVLRARPTSLDLELLQPELQATASSLHHLLPALRSVVPSASSAPSDDVSATSRSEDSSTRGSRSAPSPAG
jgi:ParB-like chromosome segregation protein Spo0J